MGPIFGSNPLQQKLIHSKPLCFFFTAFRSLRPRSAAWIFVAAASAAGFVVFVEASVGAAAAVPGMMAWEISWAAKKNPGEPYFPLSKVK